MQNGAGHALAIDHHAIGGTEIDDGDGPVPDNVDGQVFPGNMGIRYEYVATLITADNVHADFERKLGVVANQKWHSSCDFGYILIFGNAGFPLTLRQSRRPKPLIPPAGRI